MTALALKPNHGAVVQFPKKEQKVMPSNELAKGFIMKSRMFHYEVEPFLTDAAKNVYSAIMGYTNGFSKASDHISHRQIQGGKLKGSNKLSSGTVSNGLKELIWLGVIEVVEKNNKLGNKYKINEVSIVDAFEALGADKVKVLRLSNQCASISEALQLVKQPASTSGAEGAATSGASIEFLFIDSFRLKPNALQARFPLQVNFFKYQENQKEIQAKNLLDQQKAESEKKAVAAAERKEKSRKLGFDEVISLTENNIQKLCDPELWSDYVTNRSQYKKTSLTKNALNAIFVDFKTWGAEKANQSLKNSIKSNSQGLFEPRFVPTAQQAQAQQEPGYFMQMFADHQGSSVIDVTPDHQGMIGGYAHE